MNKNLFLYLIIFIEGYIVLSTELLAIRLLISHVGSGTDTTSIIIAAVLCPMAFGYYAGGHYAARGSVASGKRKTLRARLKHNFFISALFLLPALSYVLIDGFFENLQFLIGNHRLVLTTVYCLLFIVVPVYLLAQTIPLASHYFKTHDVARSTGNVLLFSTLGSMTGALFTTLVLMTQIGVHHTAFVTICCIVALYLLLEKKWANLRTLALFGLVIVALFLNSAHLLKTNNIIYNNVYHTAKLIEYDDNKRVMVLNNANAAGYKDTGDVPFPYMRIIDNAIITPIRYGEKPKDVLAIGAGGFTLGVKDKFNSYTYVDIDPDLKEYSEKFLLKQKLKPNKTFIPEPARAFLSHAVNEGKQYDFVFVDTYNGKHLPEHLITREFFESIKKMVKPNGVIAFNIIASPAFSDRFSVHLDQTLHSVFPLLSRQIVGGFSGWSDNPYEYTNILYFYFDRPAQTEDRPYTDNMNKVIYDKHQRN